MKMFDRPRYAAGDIKPGFHSVTRQPDLVIGAEPAHIDQRARTGRHAPQRLSQVVDQHEIVALADSSSPSHHNPGLANVDTGTFRLNGPERPDLWVRVGSHSDSSDGALLTVRLRLDPGRLEGSDDRACSQRHFGQNSSTIHRTQH